MHGQKGAKGTIFNGFRNEANPEWIWPDWNGAKTKPPWLYKSAMNKILLESNYGGYTEGSPLDCYKNSALQPTGGETRKIYNFSYYRPDGLGGSMNTREIIGRDVVWLDYDFWP